MNITSWIDSDFISNIYNYEFLSYFVPWLGEFFEDGATDVLIQAREDGRVHLLVLCDSSGDSLSRVK